MLLCMGVRGHSWVRSHQVLGEDRRSPGWEWGVRGGRIAFSCEVGPPFLPVPFFFLCFSFLFIYF